MRATAMRASEQSAAGRHGRAFKSTGRNGRRDAAGPLHTRSAITENSYQDLVVLRGAPRADSFQAPRAADSKVAAGEGAAHAVRSPPAALSPTPAAPRADAAPSTF